MATETEKLLAKAVIRTAYFDTSHFESPTCRNCLAYARWSKKINQYGPITHHKGCVVIKAEEILNSEEIL